MVQTPLNCCVDIIITNLEERSISNENMNKFIKLKGDNYEIRTF